MTALTVMSINSRVPGMEATNSRMERLPDNQTFNTGSEISGYLSVNLQSVHRHHLHHQHGYN